MSDNDDRRPLRFGDLELDVPAYELRRRGRPVRLERQPMDLLMALKKANRPIAAIGRELGAGYIVESAVHAEGDRGRYYLNQRTAATNEQALEYSRKATALDRDYALAWAGIAEVSATGPINSDTRPLDVAAAAREAAGLAARAAPDLAEVQMAQGFVHYFIDWDWPAAEAAFRRAIASNGRLGQAHLMLGHVLSQMGRQPEALDAIARARQAEPFAPMNHALSAQIAFQGRDYDAAVTHARQAIAVDDKLWIGHFNLAQANERLEHSDLVHEALTQAARLSGGNSKALALRGYLLGRTRRSRDARDVLGALETAAQSRYVPPYAVALVHAGLGDREAVFEWLERALDARDVHLVFLPVDPKWDPFRDDPRFKALLRRCGFASAATPHP